MSEKAANVKENSERPSQSLENGYSKFTRKPRCLEANIKKNEVTQDFCTIQLNSNHESTIMHLDS